MGSYAENEQDAREYAELKRQFAEEKLEEQRKLGGFGWTKEKPVITMDEILEHRRRAWQLSLKRDEQQKLIFMEIHQIVDNNILYGSPPYSFESAEEILLDIINDLTSVKERLGLASGNL